MTTPTAPVAGRPAAFGAPGQSFAQTGHTRVGVSTRVVEAAILLVLALAQIAWLSVLAFALWRGV